MDNGEATGRDEERIVDLSDDESLLPDSIPDELDIDRRAIQVTADDWLREERPPHWE